MMDRREFLAEALNEVQDTYIEDAKAVRRLTRELWGGMALWACAACLVMMMFGRFGFAKDMGVTLPELKMQQIRAGESADMLGLIVYNAKIYVEFAQVPASEITLGAGLDQVEASIDEHTPLSEYASWTGTIGGDLYMVPGYSSEFILALKQGDMCTLLIQNNGVTLHTGADLLASRIRLEEHCVGVQYQSRDDWFYSRENYQTYGAEHTETLTNFYKALSQSIWLEEEDVAPILGDEICHLYFLMDSGFSAEFRCFAGGYVAFDGFRGLYLKVDEAIFREVCEIW